MRALPERQLELLKMVEDKPLLIIGHLHMRGINNLLRYLVYDLGSSVTAVHCYIEEKNQVTMVAKNVDAVVFEEQLHVGEKSLFSYYADCDLRACDGSC